MRKTPPQKPAKLVLSMPLQHKAASDGAMNGYEKTKVAVLKLRLDFKTFALLAFDESVGLSVPDELFRFWVVYLFSI